MQGEEVDEEVIRHGLQIAVERVEGVRGERSGDHPFMVRFVKALVYSGPVQPAVDKVDAQIREPQEEGGAGRFDVELRGGARIMRVSQLYKER